MNKAIFLDRDGTINIEKNYLYRIEDFEYLEGVKTALLELQSRGFMLIIVTNQSGIARGYYTEEDYEYLTDWMLKDLASDGIHITDCLYCPHHPEAAVEKYRKNCSCRKPAIGLFEQAAAKYDINLSASYAIGDKMRDLAICEKTPDMKGVLVYSDKNSIPDGYQNIYAVSGGIIDALKLI